MTPEQKQKLEEQATEKVRHSNNAMIPCLGMGMTLTGRSETLHGIRRAVSRASKRYSRSVHLPPKHGLLECLRDTVFLLWNEQGAKLEIESILRETCDRVLNPEPPLPRQKLILRATALEMLGEAFSSVRSDGSTLDAEYVRVETKGSKARDGPAGKR